MVGGEAMDALEKGSPTRPGCQMPELISARQQCLDSSALRDQKWKVSGATSASAFLIRSRFSAAKASPSFLGSRSRTAHFGSVESSSIVKSSRDLWHIMHGNNGDQHGVAQVVRQHRHLTPKETGGA